MIDIVVAFLGLLYNASLLFDPTWLNEFGGLPVLVGVNMLLFLWLGSKAALSRHKALASAEVQKDLDAMNEQTIRLNRELEDQQSHIKDLEKEKAQLLKGELKLQAELEQSHVDLTKARAAQAKAEKQQMQSQTKQANGEESGAELVQFLSLLQKHGRFLDFVMGDISRYPDDRVGAAARLVHQGCAKAIHDYFDIKPILDAKEGSQIKLEDSHPRKYRFIGQHDDEQPREGRLIHKGWQTTKVDLPKRTESTEFDRVIISPAELELN